MKSEIKKILVTGVKGFMGSNTAKHFKSLGYETYGLGHGDISTKELIEYGLDYWKNSEITIQAIKDYANNFDVIVHCGGSGSVGFSVENPYLDFKKTVDGTLEVLEYMRLYSPKSHLIYPSSPAVQGDHRDEPINEEFIGKPCSPYGYHKKIAEELCRSYAEKFNLNISIVRLFSVYGIGLRKQLLWDAINKIKQATCAVEFWGTGQETRDFIHVEDVMNIFEKVLFVNDNYMVINGGTGSKMTVEKVVTKIRDNLQSNVEIRFNNQANVGNPIYYWADVNKLNGICISSFLSFDDAIKDYISWANEQKN
jgi:UDP-glucose 4-epimerase